ncbi:MFS transporter [Streptomyces fumigatiscleroticus]|nr:MFS transporter [Streptomyces fumigatiscleroticus]
MVGTDRDVVQPPADAPIGELLRDRAFRRFVTANIVSATGSAMAPLAVAYSVIEQGGGAGDLSLVLVVNTAPVIVLLLVGGLYADRLSRSALLFAGNLLAASVQAVLALSVASGRATTTSTAVCAFLSGVAMSFIAPAAQGAVAQIVPEGHLQQANAVLRLPSNAVRVLAPAIGGAIVAFSGPAWALAWDAFTFVAAALLLRGLRLDAPVTTSGVLDDLRAGWASFRTRTWLWSYTAAGTVLIAAWLAGFQLLGPLAAARQYGGARDWGLVQAAYACGLLSGTLVCLRWKPHRLLAVAVLTGAGLALPLAAMGSALPLPVVLVAAVCAGVLFDIEAVTFTTAFQQHIPHDEQGLLSAFNGLGERLAIPCGYLVTGLVAHAWDSRRALLACAGLIVVATVADLCVPDVYRVNRLTAESELQSVG